MTTSYLFSGDLKNSIGADARAVIATIDHNASDGAGNRIPLTDYDNDQTWLPGPARVTVASDLTFSVSLIASNSTGTNVTTGELRWTFTVQYVDASNIRRTTTVSNFEITANLDLSDAVGTADPPATVANAAVAEMETILAQTESIAGLTGEDAAVAYLIDNASATQTALNAAMAAPPVAFAQRLSRGLDATWLNVGDSTSYINSPWITTALPPLLGELFPALNVDVYAFTDNVGWDAGTRVVTGSGTQVLKVYNLALGGKTTSYALGLNWTLGVAPLAPDYVTVALGKNEGANPQANERTVLARFLGLVESIKHRHPVAVLDVIATPPNTPTAEATWPLRGDVYTSLLGQVAALTGAGYIDIYELFKANPTWQTDWMMPDGIHQSPTGNTVFATEVRDRIRNALDQHSRSPRPLPVSAFARQAIDPRFRDLDFATWDGTNTPPPGFTALGSGADAPTFAADATNVETGTQAVRITTTGTGVSGMQLTIAGADATRLRGKWITVAARQYVPTTDAKGAAGIVQIVDGTTVTGSWADLDGQGAFRWNVVSHKVSDTATTVSLKFLANNGSSGATGGDVTFDRIAVTESRVPCDIAVRTASEAAGSPGPAGPSGAGRACHLVTGSYCVPGPGAIATLQAAADTEYAFPVMFREAGTLDRLGIGVSTAGSTGAVVRLGLRADDGSVRPGAVLIDAGTVDATATGFAESATFSPVAVASDTLYWITVTSQGGPVTRPILRAFNGFDPLIVTTNIDNNGAVGYSHGGVSGALGAWGATFTVASTAPWARPRSA